MFNKILTLTHGCSDWSTEMCALHRLGWELLWAKDLDDVSYLLTHHEPQAGLLFLGQSSPDLCAQSAEPHAYVTDLLKSIQNRVNLDWIALYEPASLQHPAMRSLLWECCFDHSPLPPNWEEVSDMLRYLSLRAQRRRSLLSSEKTQLAPDTLGMVGHSVAIDQLRKKIRKVAATPATVLICGESGSGKELAARAIHMCSSRADGPFIAVNCAAIAPSLMQSELFGYEKGAFTGATARKRGLIEAAHGGTLFLDEIGDLSLELQANLLRFLQEKSIYRVGGLQSLALDTRVVAATHVNLQEAVAKERFREDLFYRLNVLSVEVPPLRERREDVLVLAQHFFEHCCKDLGLRPKGFSQAAIAAMTTYDWPGNIRELHNRVQSATVMTEGPWICAADLGLSAPASLNGSADLESARTQAEREMIQVTLAKVGYNITHTARELGISRMTLYRLMDKHGINP